MSLLEFKKFDACYNTLFDGAELVQLMPAMNVSYAPYQRPMLKWFAEQCRKHALVQGRDFIVRFEPIGAGVQVYVSPACASRLITPFASVQQIAKDMLFEVHRYADSTGRLLLDTDGISTVINGPATTEPD